MIETLRHIFSPDFLLHHAVYGSLVVGLVCPLVGVYFVLRRLVFWGVALPQVSAAGISFAFLLQSAGFAVLAGGESGERRLAIAAAALFTLGAIFALASLERKGDGTSEGRVGALYALAAASAILFVSSNPAGESEMMGLLRGEIVSISETDFHAMLYCFGGVAALMLAFQREFALVSYDRDMAVSLGRKAWAWDLTLYLIVGLTISLGVMTVGPLVIFGLLVIPPLTALPWSRGMLSLSLLSSLFGGASAFAGFWASYTRDLPLGPAIVCASCGALALSSAARTILKKA